MDPTWEVNGVVLQTQILVQNHVSSSAPFGSNSHTKGVKERWEGEAPVEPLRDMGHGDWEGEAPAEPCVTWRQMRPDGDA